MAEQPDSDASGGRGIRDFIGQTAAIGNVMIGAAADRNTFEPLPFLDSSEFEDKYDASALLIHINPQTANKVIYIPNTPFEVKVTGERKHGPHLFHPYVYTIELKHGPYEWHVTRTYKDLKEMHKSLAKLAKADLGHSCSDISKEQIKNDWPMFPTEHDHLIHYSRIQERSNSIAEYLTRMLRYRPYREHQAVKSFLGVSPFSFTTGLGHSLIEGFVSKRSGDNIYYGALSKLKICCEKLKIIYRKRWFLIKDSYLAFLNPENNSELRFVMLVDQYFKHNTGMSAGAFRSISIKNSQRSLVLKFKNQNQQQEWDEKLNQLENVTAKDFKMPNRYSSFAPNREKQRCKWYLNGAGYMEAVYHGIMNAKEEIYITDWWLCPEIFLKRPTDDLMYRLDKVLLKKAKEGVKIYIMLFKEVELALGLKSLRAKQILTENGRNKNIKVLRHPEHTPSGIFLWSHHEKCVIIDQTVAFMGGVDLCFGRWDDDYHRLIDLGKKENIRELPQGGGKQIEAIARGGPEGVATDNIGIKENEDNVLKNNQNAMMIAALMGNLLQKARNNQVESQETDKTEYRHTAPPTNNDESLNNDDLPAKSSGEEDNSIVNVSQFATNTSNARHLKSNRGQRLMNKLHRPKKAGHKRAHRYADSDTMVPSIEPDRLSQDLQETKAKVIRKWNRLKDTVKRKNYEIKKTIHSSSEDEDSLNEEIELPEMPPISLEGYYWPGKDYANTYQKDFIDVHEFNKDQFDRTQVPRMPWRDEALVMFGESARDLARHFIQRWNQCKREKVNHNADYPFLLPKSYMDPKSFECNWFQDQTYLCDIQVTRSLDNWSGGIKGFECSIMNAYENLIDMAEHYIYIENQFFVTTADPQNDAEVKNIIGRSIVNRIKRAHAKKEKFRIYVVVPLLPGFDNPNAIQAVQYYNLRSIVKEKFSIYSELKKNGIPDPSEYITFHSMRNWDILMGRLVHEIIYVHSKLLIVDDKYVICGSANINDRSLLGTRDSELAVVIEDTEFVSGRFNNQKVKVGKYAHSLRQKIFKLHLGANAQNKIDVTDCTTDEFYQLFRETSRKNTATYDDCFKCIPSDNILTFMDLRDYTSRSCLNNENPQEAKTRLEKDVHGYIVDFPLKFLSNEKSFYPNRKTAEGLVPIAMWT